MKKLKVAFIVIFVIVVIAITIYVFNLPHETFELEGEITEIVILQRSTIITINNNSYSLRTTPSEDMFLYQAYNENLTVHLKLTTAFIIMPPIATDDWWVIDKSIVMR